MTAAQANRQLTAGDVIDGFVVVERLGYGAFSDVYRARDGAGLDVVLKCPHEVMLGDAGTFDRFRREMTIGDRLDHPGIQRSVDSHARRSRPYLVMEFVDGQTLRQRILDDGRLSVDRAVDLARQLVDAR